MAQRHAGVTYDVGGVRPPRRRRSPRRCSAAGRRRAGQGRPVPVQLPRVPRESCSARSRPGWRRSTRTTATPTTSSSYLWDNADVVAVVFHGTFAERCAAIRDRVPRVRLWLWVDDGSGPCPDWAIAVRGRGRDVDGRAASPAPWGRSADDLVLLYTGGTTGMPKGVMWRQDDLFGSPRRGRRKRPAAASAGLGRARRPGRQARPAQPAGRAADARHRRCSTRCGTCASAASVVTMVGRHFDPVELLDTVQQRAGQQRCRSSATRSPSRSCAPSTPSRTAGTSRRCG